MNDKTLTLMAVRAHPDDECFVLGGSLARYSRQNVNTVVVICTGGENGEIVDPELNTPEVQEHLAEYRLRELQKSCEILGVRRLEMLGYRDSGMSGTPENEDPRSFNKADVEVATAKLVRLVRETRPDVIVSDNEEGGYGHPDHIMSNRITVAAYEKAAEPNYRPDLGPPHAIGILYYAAWSRNQIVEVWRRMRELGLELPWRRDEEEADSEPTWGLPDELVGAVVDVREYLDLKIQSLLAHRTQVKPDMWMLTLPRELQEIFMGYETFFRKESRLAVEGRQTELFAGVGQPDLAVAR